MSTLLVIILLAAQGPDAVRAHSAATRTVEVMRDQSATFAKRLDQLTVAAQAAAPKDLTLKEARVHARAALLAEQPHVPAELLLGLAYVESHYTADARSKGGNYCGAIQATAKRYGYSCRELYNPETGYRVGAESLERWWKTCQSKKNRKRWKNVTRCQLYGYGGVSINGSTGYPGKVLRQMKKIEKKLRSQVTAHSADV